MYIPYIPTSVVRHRHSNLLILTGIRDYIHVMDLASGHVAALSLLNNSQVGLKVNFSIITQFLFFFPSGINFQIRDEPLCNDNHNISTEMFRTYLSLQSID